VRRNPLITGNPVGHSSNDAGPRMIGEGVAFSLGRLLEAFWLGTGKTARR